MKQPAPTYQVLGFGSACVDLLFRIDERILKELHINKGDGRRLSWEDFSTTLKKCASYGYEPTLATGGSSANTIKGLKSLGNPVAFYGKRGQDPLGTYFQDNLKNLDITTLLSLADIPTSQIAVFVTEDHQRSFLSFAGANHLMDQEPLENSLFKGVRLVHIEGYMIDELPLTYVQKIMQMAKQHCALVSLDMGCPRIAKTYKNEILELIESYVDITFANQDEIHALLNLSPEKGCQTLAQLGCIATIGVGADGCWTASQEDCLHSPAIQVNPIDTTGAGDLFASGFLHALLHGANLATCAHLGNVLGGTAVTVFGAEIPAHKWPDLNSYFSDLLPK